MERLRTFWEFLRTSFWFVPSVMSIGAVVLLALTLGLEARLGTRIPQGGASWLLYAGTPDDARAVLSTILSSMITMASLVFSITMVVLTLAAGQFGPRLIRSFMANPQTQIVLGTFVMTIVYCLLVLPAIGLRQTTDAVPHASVSVAVALTVISVGLLVLFLHSLARSIVSETVIDRVGRELEELLESYPALQPADAPADDAEEALPPDFGEQAAVFGPLRDGYVQAVRFEALAAIAERADVLIGLYFRAGDYVVEGGRGVAVYPRDRSDPDLVAAIRAAILIGTHRTPVQDPDFSIRHLVEIAVRALSPGVNDPYTAVAVVDRLSASLSRLMGRALPQPVTRDRAGAARVVCPAPTYASLVGASFNQIRQNGAGTPVVVLHLLEAILRIAEHVRRPDQREALSEQARVIVEAARRRIDDPSDRQAIDARYRAAREALDRTASEPPRRAVS